jgi:hypothetical protein
VKDKVDIPVSVFLPAYRVNNPGKCLKERVQKKINLFLEETLKVQRGCRGVALLFLEHRR